LASQPNPVIWGSYYAGLLAGNLDATHDYTGDGMNAQELAKTLNNIPAADPADSGYLVEQQERHNSLLWAYYYASSAKSVGEFRFGKFS
jgi:penicillin V acylase-like amidase (Ntn superfamily)